MHDLGVFCPDLVPLDLAARFDDVAVARDDAIDSERLNRGELAFEQSTLAKSR